MCLIALKFCLCREDDVPSDVYGGPPLEHDIAANEADGTVACYAATSSGVLWDGVENLDQVHHMNYLFFILYTGTKVAITK